MSQDDGLACPVRIVDDENCAVDHPSSFIGVGTPVVLENMTVEITDSTPPASGSLGSLGAIFGS
ncbi:hypothetical protein [Rhodococcus sp. IEGM 1379]|uniref:hypothetical protein n=1 Tax=Rhodococcus sp. IEGM 1379 TaxID=3047086 RepID=UPI0024B7A31B|nr:hypothetical protein [Rhodococcus sp. IEGM 1379]MDI9915815.1 hypothetical protein [Rhodococcus sp. IEGM 1379]